ncbi:GNAT family N-acetyltransferase [Leptolyngbya sp. AN02str]|uniref:GNAT family N-acetyltransferase n=1 Tax=Leptolyngbya sp. AN02str TaxID=3423363 RepID=UPI003D31120D
MEIDVTTWYLDMHDAHQLRCSSPLSNQVSILQATVPSPELNRFLYTSVGGNWYWCDRLVWTYDQWMDYLDRPEVQTWVAYVGGNPAGYVELEAQPKGDVEIVYFGLLPAFVGQGLGGHLLTVGVQRAWQMPQTQRVWVHTCSLDGPYALKNYESRGFTVYHQETKREQLPDVAPGPWPGAGYGDGANSRVE